MYLPIEPTLYLDLQASKPIGYCEECLGALYEKDAPCIRCLRRAAV